MSKADELVEDITAFIRAVLPLVEQDPDALWWWTEYRSIVRSLERYREMLSSTDLEAEEVSDYAREVVLRRDEGRCRYCGEKAVAADHVVPVRVGGEGGPENLVAVCGSCNRRKKARMGFGLRRATAVARGRLGYGKQLISPEGSLFGEKLWEYVEANPTVRQRRFARRPNRQRKLKGHEEQT